MFSWQELQRPVIAGTCTHADKRSQITFHHYSSIWMTLSSGHYSPVLVDNTTSALLRIWAMAAVSLFFSSFLSSPISRFKFPRSPFSFFIPVLEQSQRHKSFETALKWHVSGTPHYNTHKCFINVLPDLSDDVCVVTLSQDGIQWMFLYGLQ